MRTVSDPSRNIHWSIEELALERDDLARFFADNDDAGLDEPTSGPADEPRLPFAELIETHAAYFRSLGTPVGDWLSGQLEELADMARTLRANSPDTYDARLEVLEADRVEMIRAQGFDSACDANYLRDAM
jgi:hypothetical protein